MRIVIDTNILWVSISKRSKSHWIFQALINGEVELAVTTDILEEYEEIIGSRLGPEVASYVLETFDNLPNIVFTEVYYRWALISEDPDDNKFVDCAVASGSDYIVTNDRHFNVLDSIDFPPVKAIRLEYFEKIMLEGRSD